jgi:hypothetical protein
MAWGVFTVKIEGGKKNNSALQVDFTETKGGQRYQSHCHSGMGG